LKGRSGRTRRRGHWSFKANRKVGGTGTPLSNQFAIAPDLW